MATKKSKQAPEVRVRVKGGKDPRDPKQVLGQAIVEDGVRYEPGTEFVTSEERADALGDSIDILGPVTPAAEEPTK